MYQGESKNTSDNFFLGSLNLHGVAPRPRGVPSIVVTLQTSTRWREPRRGTAYKDLLGREWTFGAESSFLYGVPTGEYLSATVYERSAGSVGASVGATFLLHHSRSDAEEARRIRAEKQHLEKFADAAYQRREDEKRQEKEDKSRYLDVNGTYCTWNG